jgi:Na+-translocating ferredoxin:NAD+ oxidoreductase RNF subunit RnfB
MRVAAIEDKLGQMNVTEEEMRAYQKVASLMGGRAAAAPMIPQVCTTCSNCVSVIAIPISSNCIHIRPVGINDCIQFSPQAVAANPLSGATGFAGLGTR